MCCSILRVAIISIFEPQTGRICKPYGKVHLKWPHRRSSKALDFLSPKRRKEVGDGPLMVWPASWRLPGDLTNNSNLIKACGSWMMEMQIRLQEQEQPCSEPTVNLAGPNYGGPH
jgi:hypothetical protein